MPLEGVDGACSTGPELVDGEGEEGTDVGVGEGAGDAGVGDDVGTRLGEDVVGHGVAEEAFEDGFVLAGLLGEGGEGGFGGEGVEVEAKDGLEAEEGVVLEGVSICINE